MESKGVLVLIVDDDLNNLDVVSTAMKEAGHNVLKAVDLEQARAAIKSNTPSLVILDRNLPDGDGIEFCTELRSSTTCASVPILFLTVRDSEKEKVMGLDRGADDYLPKPFGVKELQARVGAILRRVDRKRHVNPKKGES